MRQEKTTTLIRQWYILRLLRHVHYVSTQDIKDSLLSHYSIDVDLRTIQRDLQGLMTIFPLECRKDSVPYGWRWEKEAKHELPISQSQALTFMMVETQLKDILPHTVLRELQPYFDASKAIVGVQPNIPFIGGAAIAGTAGIGLFHGRLMGGIFALTNITQLFHSRDKHPLSSEREKQAFKALFTLLDEHNLSELSHELSDFVHEH